jgi:glycosyltransferase involved in cell wall biosynthesis
MSAPLVCMLSAAHPPADVRVVGKEGAALASAGWRVMHLCPAPARQDASAPLEEGGAPARHQPLHDATAGPIPAGPALAAPATSIPVTSTLPAPATGALAPGALIPAASTPAGPGLAAPNPATSTTVVTAASVPVAPAPVLASHAGVAIHTYRRAPGWRGRLLGIPALARRAAATGAAVLHASEPDAWIAAILAARRSGARVVLDVHEHYPSRLDHRLPKLLRPLGRAGLRLACRLSARAADAVVVAKDGLDADFAAPGRTIPVRNYATPAAVTPRCHAPGPLTLVHLGALGRARGAWEMLDALALCPPDTRLRLIGRFTDGSGEAFSARAAELGLIGQIDQLGWMPHEAALQAAAGADIGLVLFQPGVENHRLALPHKLFDCMQAGLPIIAPAFAEEVASVVREAACGLLVPTDDPAAIAAAIHRLRDPVMRAGMGANGRDAALGRFGWGAEAARLIGLYRRLAPLPATPAVTATTTPAPAPLAAA